MTFEDTQIILSKGRALSYIRTRIETLVFSKGLTWAEVYKELGWYKSFASYVLNGLLIPRLEQRIKLASYLNVDSYIIWNTSDIVLAKKLSEEQQEVVV